MPFSRERVAPGPGQESVWDYPRPPRLEPVVERLRVVFAGLVVADTAGGFRVLETRHPPVYYFPPDDVRQDLIVPVLGRSFCEWKGEARYVSAVAGDRRSERAGWFYPDPTPEFVSIRNFVAFYASRIDAAFVGEERVGAQPGDFYGGWITSRIVGPFKGEPGTGGW